MIEFTLKQASSSYEAYRSLIDLYYELDKQFFEEVKVVFDTSWFDATYCSFLGAILDSVLTSSLEIEFSEQSLEVKQILQRNKFLSFWGYDRIADNFQSTIPFQKILRTQSARIETEIIKTIGQRLDNSSNFIINDKVKTWLKRSIFEVLSNAKIHSESSYIYTCGQFFPKKKKLSFMITDAGISFKNKVNSTLGKSLTSSEAIEWAIKYRNSTKKITGGLGLEGLLEFVKQNKGKLEIISGDAYYSVSHDETVIEKFGKPFLGSSVNITVNMDSDFRGMMAEELNDQDLF